MPFIFARATQPHADHPERNEDTILVDRQRGLVAVFDGVGGSRAGAVASRLAAQSIAQGWKQYYKQQTFSTTSTPSTPSASATGVPCQFDALHEVLRQLVEQANQYIHAETIKLGVAGENSDAPSTLVTDDTSETTIALLVFCQQEGNTSAVYAHVGDSRIYLLEANGTLHRLTEDDGFLSILLEHQEITPQDALRIDQTTQPEQLSEEEQVYFSKRNGITQALGDAQPLNVHVGQHPFSPGDKLLLCTDGIHDNLTDVEIAHVMSHSGKTTAAKRLVEKATWRSQEPHVRAKNDDMSAVVVSFDG